ncbi:MAG: 50S ribosomal protein L2 [Candidatus Hydrothermarchaeota archaeon]|nr:MAG: 50S ribosomal protein L2 [Candidatus Hydrothermarchaeota archaeon]
MGKRIISQRRGKGSSTYRAPSHRYKAEIKYRKYDEIEREGVIKGEIIDFIKDPGRSAPLAIVRFEDGAKIPMLACEGVKIGDEVMCGAKASISHGNVLPLKNIPEGTPIFNIERNPGDGGKLVRASGTYALLITHDVDRTVVQLPSGELKTLDSRCRATIGIVGGGGRKDKPIMKAGKKYHMLKSKAKYWPIVRKVVMNPVDHPYGGKSHRPGKATTISRNAPPGRKVGHIAARRTGRR